MGKVGIRGRGLGWMVAGAALLTLAACQSTSRVEDTLSAAGFRIKLADTPQKLASLQQLPPKQFVARSINNQIVWLYADPDGCKCVYYGSQMNYQTYQGLRFDARVASQNLVAAQINSDPWDYGVWGGEVWY